MIYLFPASMHSLIKEQQTARFADRQTMLHADKLSRSYALSNTH